MFALANNLQSQGLPFSAAIIASGSSSFNNKIHSRLRHSFAISISLLPSRIVELWRPLIKFNKLQYRFAGKSVAFIDQLFICA
jgi:hypothetical protein